MTYPSDSPPPWRYYTAKRTAKKLGVRTDLIRGLANSAGLRAHLTRGHTGQEVWLFNADDVDRLVNLSEAANPNASNLDPAALLRHRAELP